MNQTPMARLQALVKNADVLAALGVVAILFLMVAPLSPLILDLFLVASFAGALAMLMMAIYSKNALETSMFPSLLLIVTLFRLSLNVASTRLILTNGHVGGSAAGELIRAFGEFVVKGNYVVGLIVFLILIIINFVVITKGAGRVSEVAARFTLDALPGKQMAIDADLNAGIINETIAKERRKQVQEEADFYGSMDGASKFVRGDAIAGLLITLVNILGGLIIGTLQKGLDISVAAKNYTLLTVGDGLVSQVPALIISTAAGLVVTRSSSDKSLGDLAGSQLFWNENIFFVVSGILFSLGVILQGAFVPFFVLSMFSLGLAMVLRRSKAEKFQKEEEKRAQELLLQKNKQVEAPEALEALQLEVGYGLISIVENKNKGDLLERIQSVRKQFIDELGVVVPPVKIRDNLQLKPGEYVIYVRGAEVGRGDLMVDHFMAMDPGGVTEQVDGIPAKEPVFGLDALWIHENKKELAQLAGYTVVDLATIIATHITEIIRKNAYVLVGRQETQVLLDNLKKTHPKLVDDLIPKEISLGAVVKVLQNLLREGVSIRDLVTILEAIGDGAALNKEVDFLTEYVRTQISRTLTQKLLGPDGELSLFTFSREVEEKLINSVHPGERSGTTQFLVDPALVKKLVPQLNNLVQDLNERGITPVLLVTPIIRLHVKRLLDRFLPTIVVLSHNEIGSDLRVKSVGTVDVT